MTAVPRGVSPLEEWVATSAGSFDSDGGKLAAYRSAKIRETLRRVASASPFYRKRLAGIDIDRISGPAGFGALPFTTADDLREEGHRMLCVSQSAVERVVTLDTSGTTGRPKRIFFTEADLRRTVEYFRIGMSTFTRRGDRVLILLPGGKPGSIGELLSDALLGIGAVPLLRGFVEDAPLMLADIRSGRVDCVVGVPNQVLALARYHEAAGAPPEDGPRRVLLSTDYAPEAVASEIRRVWRCETIAYYAMTELGYGGGIECGARDGYHLYENDIYFEVVDPATGRPASRGEVVATTLAREGMPLIRYRTGDLSLFLCGTCPCGSPLRRLDRIRSRLGGAVPFGAGGGLRLSDLDESLFPLPGVLDFSARFEGGDAGTGTLTVRIDVLGNPLSESAYRERVLAAAGMRSVPPGSRVRIEIVGLRRGDCYAPRLGKRRIVSDLV